MTPPDASHGRGRRPAGHAPATRLSELRGRHGLSVLPSVPPLPPPGPDEITVASYNVHKCVGTDRRFDPGRIAQVIAEIQPDILAVQEADRRFGRRIGLLDTQALQQSGLSLVPVSRLPDGHGWHGNALLVRRGTPLEVQRLALPGAEPRGAVLTEIELPAGKLRIVAAHFGLLRRCRLRQAATILEAIARGTSMPTLMLGDLNEWRPGPRSSLRPLESLFGSVAFGPASFPSRMPVFALDRIFGWPRGVVRDVQAHNSSLARIASDHLPLKARLSLAAAHAAPSGEVAAAA
ncbi:EEP domain-containing protein [Roseomonas sp. M0104]|uniref:EEP domain-containing protein n=1 Tax=Teichococcus coralli TaxID=2545983 RepID=A0A845BHB6_9PROT|nr:endonuclease/exonuclease/phosphatase family protein [Pseudoroseomonas coralli]MXP65526.1 EEP domain-containing protein [Pseudoroseomonas coralli]